MNALVDFGSTVCEYWKLGNEYAARAIVANPDQVATAEALGAATLVGARIFGKFGVTNMMAFPIVAAAFGLQASAFQQQFFCGSPESARAVDEGVREINAFQWSVPTRAYNQFSSIATTAYDHIQSAATTACEFVKNGVNAVQEMIWSKEAE